MLDADTEEATGELADAIAQAAHVDPRAIPTRYSLLKTLALSPAHYYHAAQRPQDDSLASRLGAFATDRKEALRFGTAVHLMLLGERERVARYVGRRAGKVWESFQVDAAEDGAMVIVNEREHAMASLVVAAITRNGRAMSLLFDDTKVEQRIDWEFVGKACRSTPDARGKRHVVDLKTAVSAKPDMFQRAGERLFYHAQAALYCDAIEAAGAPRPSDAYVIAVEKTPPFPVTILRFTERALDIGARLCRTWIEQLNACEAANQWPEYSEAVVDFDIDHGVELEFGGATFAM